KGHQSSEQGANKAEARGTHAPIGLDLGLEVKQRERKAGAVAAAVPYVSAISVSTVVSTTQPESDLSLGLRPEERKTQECVFLKTKPQEKVTRGRTHKEPKAEVGRSTQTPANTAASRNLDIGSTYSGCDL